MTPHAFKAWLKLHALLSLLLTLVLGVNALGHFELVNSGAISALSFLGLVLGGLMLMATAIKALWRDRTSRYLHIVAALCLIPVSWKGYVAYWTATAGFGALLALMGVGMSFVKAKAAPAS